VGKDADPRWIHDLNFKMFNSILPHARRYGIKVATETFGDALGGEVCDFFGSCREFIPSFDRIAAAENGEFLTACMDTGHTNKAMRFYNNPSPGDFIRSLGPRLGILHLHDNNGVDDLHMPPYSCLANGRHHVCNWDSLVEGLKEIGYRGVLAFETFRVYSAYPADVRTDALKLIASIGRSWSKRIEGEE
jgi:sugar phosphate isomerase/epimerase